MKAKNIKQRIKEYFLTAPNSKLRVRQIERKLKLPLPSVIRYCRELKEEGVLETQRNENVVFYVANKASKVFLLEKKLFNLRSIYESRIIEHLKQELSNPSVVLFGSYARGEDIESSDIDLYVETASKKDIDVGSFEKALNRKIQIFRHKNIREVDNSRLANNIINGVLLNGFVEVFE